MAVNNAIDSGGILTFAAGKTLTVNKILTLDGTDSTTMTFPTTSATIARTDAGNTFTGHQTVEGVTSTGATGTGKFVFDDTPTLITPALGAATATSVNALLLSFAGNSVLVGTSGGIGGSSNTFVGKDSGVVTVGATAAFNTGIGAGTMTGIGNAGSNTAVGYNSLGGVTDGDTNTAIGVDSLVTNATGSGNVAVGYYAGAYETGSDAFYVDNQNRTNTAGDKAKALLYGTFAATAASQTLMVNGVLSTSVVGNSAGNVVTTDGTQTLSNKTITESWTEVTGTSQALAVNNRYILNNAGLVTATLPATAAVGSRIRIVGKGAGGWKVAQNASQFINIGSSVTTTGASGHIDSTVAYDCMELLCTTANNGWLVISSMGNLTIV